MKIVPSFEVDDAQLISLIHRALLPLTQEIHIMLQQIADLKTAADALAAKTDQLVTANATLVTLAGTLKSLLEQAIAGTLTAADQQTLSDVRASLDTVTAKLQTVVQADSDANTVDQPSN